MSLPLFAFERIARKAGIKRISRDAVEELRDIIEERGEEIARKAIRLATHANRLTVLKRDIKLAVED